MKTKARAFKSISRILPVALFIVVGASAPDIATASSGYSSDASIFAESCSMLNSIKGWLFGVVYVLGAIGLVLIAISAFLGRFKFAHLISLGGGLFIVAAADLLIDFLTAGRGETSC